MVRPQGSYGHDVSVRKMPFWFKPSRWTLRRGDLLSIVVDSAEPLKGRPVISVKAPERDWVDLKVARADEDTFRATFKTRKAWSRARCASASRPRTSTGAASPRGTRSRCGRRTFTAAPAKTSGWRQRPVRPPPIDLPR